MLIKPLTKKQLLECFKAYREAFPAWDVEHEVMLTRREGPVKQFIGFHALRSGAYRPTCGVTVIISKGVNILDQFLDVRHRQILLRQHQERFPRIIQAMNEQFRPAIQNPLNLEEVLRLGEESVLRDRIVNINHFNALAALNSYIGKKERGLYWCDRVNVELPPIGGELPEWERAQIEYTSQLREAIIKNEERDFLESVMRQGEKG